MIAADSTSVARENMILRHTRPLLHFKRIEQSSASHISYPNIYTRLITKLMALNGLLVSGVRSPQLPCATYERNRLR